jgi:O-antigen/teichoic acid export membrane protein
LVILAVLTRQLIWPVLPRERGGIVRESLRSMLAESWPLMASLLLQALFPGINALLLQYFHDDVAVGWYGAGRKWVDALNIVPAFFTIAVFPVVSRLAAEDRASLLRSYRLSVKLLTMVALLTVVLVTLLATGLVGLLSGRGFLPQGAQILQILIWSIVCGWLNSLTNYVLIALHRQRYVLAASGARVFFTIAANLLFVRTFGYIASAWILVSGELLLALLFHVDLRRQLGAFRWPQTLGRTVLAGLVTAAAVWAMASFNLPLALLTSVLLYPAALGLLRAVTGEEWELLSPLLPARWRRVASLHSRQL